MKTILVPLNFSPESEGVIASTLELVRAFGGRVLLLHVVEPVVSSEYVLPVDVIQETLLVSEGNAQSRISSYVKTFQAAHIEVESIVCQGSPAFVILAEAAKHNVNFIVMGTSTHGRLYDLLLGSTAHGVIRAAPCPVMVIPPQELKDT